MGETPTKEEMNRSALIIGTIFAAFGGLLMILGNGLGSPSAAVTLFITGLGLSLLGLVTVWKGSDMGEAYVQRKKTAESLAKDKGGIIWVWLVVLLAIGILAIAYFSLVVVAYMVLDSVEAFYSFNDDAMGTLGLMRNVLAWFLIIMVIGLLAWGLINSARREDQTYGY